MKSRGIDIRIEIDTVSIYYWMPISIPYNSKLEIYLDTACIEIDVSISIAAASGTGIVDNIGIIDNTDSHRYRYAISMTCQS